MFNSVQMPIAFDVEPHNLSRQCIWGRGDALGSWRPSGSNLFHPVIHAHAVWCTAVKFGRVIHLGERQVFRRLASSQHSRVGATASLIFGTHFSTFDRPITTKLGMILRLRHSQVSITSLQPKAGSQKNYLPLNSCQRGLMQSWQIWPSIPSMRGGGGCTGSTTLSNSSRCSYRVTQIYCNLLMGGNDFVEGATGTPT